MILLFYILTRGNLKRQPIKFSRHGTSTNTY
jgi:hypothetical protein